MISQLIRKRNIYITAKNTVTYTTHTHHMPTHTFSNGLTGIGVREGKEADHSFGRCVQDGMKECLEQMSLS